MRYTAIIFLAFFLAACKESSNSPGTENPDLLVDQSYVTPKAGDPRGQYVPNRPFVFYFGQANDSLISNISRGTFQINGTTSSSGTFSLAIVTAIGGTVGYNGRLPIPDTTTLTGTWSASGTTISFSFADKSDSTSYSVDSKGLYLIVPVFYYFPPIARLNHQEDPGVPGVSIWVFKK